jgi:hypothetical protein
MVVEPLRPATAVLSSVPIKSVELAMEVVMCGEVVDLKAS